jgi:hypothetical protein
MATARAHLGSATQTPIVAIKLSKISGQSEGPSARWESRRFAFSKIVGPVRPASLGRGGRTARGAPPLGLPGTAQLRPAPGWKNVLIFSPGRVRLGGVGGRQGARAARNRAAAGSRSPAHGTIPGTRRPGTGPSPAPRSRSWSRSGPGGGAVTYRHARSTGTGSVSGFGVRLRAVTAVAAVPAVYGRSA